MLVWKRNIDDIISFFHTNRYVVNQFFGQANKPHPTIEFTSEMSFLETTFLEATIPKGERFNKESVFDMRTHFKLTDASKYTILHNVSPTRSKERLR